MIVDFNLTTCKNSVFNGQQRRFLKFIYLLKSRIFSYFRTVNTVSEDYVGN